MQRNINRDCSASPGQEQVATILDRGLRCLGKSLQQPRQYDFEPNMIVGDVEMARGRLPERADAEDHAMILPSLLVNFQDRNARGRARQPDFEATDRLIAAEPVWNRNDQRGGHPKTSWRHRLCSGELVTEKSFRK
jgi:hypothetical protein